MFREVLRWLAKSRLRTALAILFFWITFLLSVGLFSLYNHPLFRSSSSDLIALAGMVTAIGSVIGTVSTVVLAWRTDRRTAKEAELKLVQMQQQIKELETKLATSSQATPRILEK